MGTLRVRSVGIEGEETQRGLRHTSASHVGLQETRRRKMTPPDVVIKMLQNAWASNCNLLLDTGRSLTGQSTRPRPALFFREVGNDFAPRMPTPIQHLSEVTRVVLGERTSRIVAARLGLDL